MSCDVVHVQRIAPIGQVWVSCLMMLYCIASYLNDSAFALCCFELYLWVLLQAHVWHKCYCPLLLGREAIQTGKKSFHLITSLPDVIHWLVTPHAWLGFVPEYLLSKCTFYVTRMSQIHVDKRFFSSQSVLEILRRRGKMYQHKWNQLFCLQASTTSL